MAKKDDKEFASKQQEAPNTDKVDAKLNREPGPPTAKAADINTLLPEAGEDVGEAQVQARVDAENEAGFRGIDADPTPNANYTVGGVTSGAATPETDDDLRAEARAARKLDGPNPS